MENLTMGQNTTTVTTTTTTTGEAGQGHGVINLVDAYQNFMNKGDPRVKDWLFMSSPLPTMAMCGLYFVLTVWLGPWFMRNRKPFDLRRVIIFYNGFQVLFSTWLFYQFGQGGWFHNYSLRCQPVDYTEHGMLMVHASWWYYASKYTEFFDTFFFILRGKMEHVSTLHLFHHGVMPLSIWFGAKFLPGGHSTLMALLNTLVHMVMYFYYMMAAMGPGYAKYIWWKRHVTTFQIIQFLIIFVHSFQIVFTDCDYPKESAWFIGLHGVLFLSLFSNFYNKTYKKPIQNHRHRDRDNLSTKSLKSDGTVQEKDQKPVIGDKLKSH